MKSLNNYIQEKYLIDIDTNIDPLNKVFNNLDDLINALNNYFGDELESSIKVNKSNSKMPANNQKSIILNVYNTFTINKKEPVNTVFKKIKTIKGAVLQYNNKLILQGIYGIGKESELGFIDTKKAYTFGKDNFYEWIDNNVFYGFHDFFHIPQVNLG